MIDVERAAERVASCGSTNSAHTVLFAEHGIVIVSIYIMTPKGMAHAAERGRTLIAAFWIFFRKQPLFAGAALNLSVLIGSLFFANIRRYWLFCCSVRLQSMVMT
ncbi:hypothetical protein [Actinomadura meyerae]|uniref:hypothetical protein n=1 Tax=Actinomadura meyerae TaxID=240840 RepID=UPI0015C5B1CB|nr:hypothetical protein [Actinomadura meyerae]